MNKYEPNNEPNYEKNDETDDDSVDETNNNYLFKTNVNRTLSKVLGIEEIKDFQVSDYEPPKKSGLSNSDIIIPKYYNLHKNPNKLFDISYYKIIKDDIRNCRLLNEYQINYIKTLSHEEKNELFDIYNQCTKLYNDIINF
jgi:hypothetical protein